MKYLFLFLIEIYKIFVSPIIKNLLGVRSFCRLSPSCSEYAKSKIKQYGAAKGGLMSLLRFLRCQPFSSPTATFRSGKRV